MERLNMFASIFNGILIVWNCISLLAEQATISLNSVGILWIFNFSNAILISERYFPEIKNKVAKGALFATIALGNVLAIILMCTEKVSPNLVFCFIFNVIGFFISLIAFVLKNKE
tara:strand:- start:3909 stop:4253 length:345 start_codon:yes stop_codon:yes gene_type:complete